MTNNVVQVEHLSKRYQIGVRQERYAVLRDRIMENLRAPSPCWWSGARGSMCGIAGIGGAQVSEESSRAMSAAQCHCGPDAEGVFFNHSAAGRGDNSFFVWQWISLGKLACE